MFTRRPNLPWLYYANSQESLTSKSDIQLKVAFNAEAAGSEYDDMLQFYLGTYHVNGSIISLSPLTNQLHQVHSIYVDVHHPAVWNLPSFWFSEGGGGLQ